MNCAYDVVRKTRRNKGLSSAFRLKEGGNIFRILLSKFCDIKPSGIIWNSFMHWRLEMTMYSQHAYRIAFIGLACGLLVPANEPKAERPMQPISYLFQNPDWLARACESGDFNGPRCSRHEPSRVVYIRESSLSVFRK